MDVNDASVLFRNFIQKNHVILIYNSPELLMHFANEGLDYSFPILHMTAERTQRAGMRASFRPLL